MHQPIDHDFDIQDYTQHDPIDEKPFYKWLIDAGKNATGNLVTDLARYMTGIPLEPVAAFVHLASSFKYNKLDSRTVRYIHSEFWRRQCKDTQ